MDGADPDVLEPISRLSSEKSLKLQKFLKNNLQRKKVAEISYKTLFQENEQNNETNIDWTACNKEWIWK